MARNFIFPPSTRYTCIQCGRCCTHWAVKVEDKVAEKILDYDWGESYPDLKGYDICIRRKTDLAEGDVYFMRMKKNGRCPFLEENNFCRIHTDLGYDAKPAGCKLFPLTLLEGTKSVHVRTSYYCPAVTANEGKALTAQTTWMNRSYRLSGAQQLDDAIYLTEGMRVKLADMLVLESSLLKILKMESLSVRESLLMGGALIDNLIAGMEMMGIDDKSRIPDKLRQLEKVDFDPLMEEIDLDPPSPLRGRLALGLFLIQDSRPTTISRMARIPGILRFILNLGSLESHLLEAKAALSKIHKVEYTLSDESVTMLKRFFEQKIAGKRYLENGMAADSGWALICAAYAFTELLAKLKAASGGLDKTSHEDIVEAIGITDLLVIEHTVFFQMDATRGLVGTVLSQPDMYRNVIGAV